MEPKPYQLLIIKIDGRYIKGNENVERLIDSQFVEQEKHKITLKNQGKQYRIIEYGEEENEQSDF